MATFTLDIPNRRIETADTDLTVQEIHDACRGFEDLPQMMSQAAIVAASGKSDVGGGLLGGIYLTMINDWRLYATPSAGPTWQEIIVSGGTLIALNTYSNNPIENSAFNNWQVRQSTDSTIVESGTSGLTAAESQALLDIDSNVDDLVINVTTLTSDVATLSSQITTLLAAQDLTNEQKEAEHFVIQATYPLSGPGTLVLRNTTALRRWEAAAWEDSDGTIGYRGTGLDRVGMLVEVVYS